MKQKMLVFLLSSMFRFFSFLPVLPNLYVFESQYGGRFDDNPKAIYDCLKKENKPENKLFWSIRYRDRKIVGNEDVNVLYRFSIRWLYYMARANFWIVNARMPQWLKKREETKYVQTWHGTPLKKLALDMDTFSMPGSNLETYKTNFLAETKKWDYLVAPNQYSEKIFRSCFAFEKSFIESGYPRNDVLYQKNNPTDINEIKKRLDLPLDKKVILYAPTWRDDYYISQGKYKFYVPFNIEKLIEILDDKAVFIFRAHYLVADSLSELADKPNIYNFSKNEDISDLYLVSDLLITDYSSVFFDYANLKRSMLFYAYDFEHYRDNLRGFYFDLENDAPGPFVTKEEEFHDYLCEFIKENDIKESDEKLAEFGNKFCAWEDGKAAKKIIEVIQK
ncbi:CDP-glycerol glycerophosphotransferase [Carnobacterium iners]|uniref:CDP-glycerol glycerophosphotransferase n=1 Tax=Carnobacterium iners TaxID=1073423 RepID=A0A1X7NAJ3_9LACT|nr:CDP-glycerol glycerophosphotransferase family protein [Carnobacterium iners]SEL18394.1 CDP-glycerol glycerophosphotransferase [Carnobacterium iners]SMH33787.1 CDP-glycerol glycerophosphotransferase [Carnobacterium iners]